MNFLSYKRCIAINVKHVQTLYFPDNCKCKSLKKIITEKAYRSFDFSINEKKKSCKKYMVFWPVSWTSFLKILKKGIPLKFLLGTFFQEKWNNHLSQENKVVYYLYLIWEKNEIWIPHKYCWCYLCNKSDGIRSNSKLTYFHLRLVFLWFYFLHTLSLKIVTEWHLFYLI